MRILFAYFDFTEKNDTISPRPLGQCALNFSTTHTYAVQKEGEGEKAVYTVSHREKPENEKLPKGFWGDRIYNISAIVGNNGSGKSTLLHNLIKAVVKGLKPDVPFLLALQTTGSEELCLYCSEKGRFVWEGPKNLIPKKWYPDRLHETKTMLLDNTLSMSSIELYKQYSNFVSQLNQSGYAKRIRPKPIPEKYKQFYNKSLTTSIRYSNAATLEGKKDQSQVSVTNALDTHFRYESLQEIRFLFDRYQQENLNALEYGGFSVPRPKYVSIHVCSLSEQQRMINEVYATSGRKINSIPMVCSMLYQEKSFWGPLLANTMFNLYASLVGSLAGGKIWGAVDDIDSAFSINYTKDQSTIEIAEKIVQAVATCLENVNNKCSYPSEWRIELVLHYKQFVRFISENEKNLRKIFKPSPFLKIRDASFDGSVDGGRDYFIDVGNIISDSQMQQILISFLELYQQVSEPYEFLTFSSGMSSGEKNFLRMLTQFRFMLDSPAADAKGATENCLRSLFPVTREEAEECVCDTLFLFLDEVDLTYHPEWQRVLISKLTAVLPRMFRDPYDKNSKYKFGCKDIQVILATHSPLMLGDFPKASVNYLKTNAQDLTEVDDNPPPSTFGENLYTILRDGFFMKDTVGEFAKKKITAAVKWCHAVREAEEELAEELDGPTAEERKRELSAAFQDHYQTARLLPPGIIQNKLLSELKQCADKLGIPIAGETESEKIARLQKRLSDRQNEVKRLKEELQKARKQHDQDS